MHFSLSAANLGAAAGRVDTLRAHALRDQREPRGRRGARSPEIGRLIAGATTTRPIRLRYFIFLEFRPAFLFFLCVFLFKQNFWHEYLQPFTFRNVFKTSYTNTNSIPAAQLYAKTLYLFRLFCSVVLKCINTKHLMYLFRNELVIFI